MTNTTEIEPVVEQKHQDPKAFVDLALETADHPYPPQPIPAGGSHSAAQAGVATIGVPHYDAKHHHEGEHKHHEGEHAHEHHEHPDAFHAYGDKLVGHSENAAAPIHNRPVA
ncbi:hypothetical protein BGZ54_003785 [Gamsiella multidivaricata]|nr:hypothetical protein BGZ54_003785 [Gamsiella multidivaricata]